MCFHTFSFSQSSEIKLIHSDVVSSSSKIPEAVKLNGNVHFKHENRNLFCDSAIFHQTQNWMYPDIIEIRWSASVQGTAARYAGTQIKQSQVLKLEDVS